MKIKNVKIFCAEHAFSRKPCFRDGSLVLDGARIQSVSFGQPDDGGAGMTGQTNLTKRAALAQCKQEEVIDGGGAYAIPGLIDLHFHGCMGDDFCDADAAALARIAAYEASVGVTAIAPATMTLPVEKLEQVLRVAAEYASQPTDASHADLVGINMEGPFISHAKKGAQDERYILPCDEALCDQFLEWSQGLVKFIGIAPEACGDAAHFITAVRDRVNVSLAHTNADYETALAACRAGANHAVHLYNAMPEFSHREPGVVGAVCDSPGVFAELICDGIHVHPSVVRSTFRMMGAERMLLISDSMRATGLSDGRYTLGGLEVAVTGKRAALVSDGTIAGSVTHLMDCVRTAVHAMHLPLEIAVACASVNPAKSLGIYDEYGSLDAGKRANIVLLSQALELQAVFKDGVKIRS